VVNVPGRLGRRWGHGYSGGFGRNCYATGYTDSSGWVSGGWQTTFGEAVTALWLKLSAAGAHLWSTYLGGSAMDAAKV